MVWGVYRSPKSGNIYLSDTKEGLRSRPAAAGRGDPAGFRCGAGSGGVALRGSSPVKRAMRDIDRATRDASPSQAAFLERARFGLDVHEWRDADVARGTSYIYRLALDAEDGTHLLGEVRATAPAPGRSHLLGNVPNPFNPSTNVRFELAAPGGVRLAIYDTRGRLVRELLRPHCAAGTQAIAWDGRDGRDRSLPSGAYLYELHSGGWRARGRMNLVK